MAIQEGREPISPGALTQAGAERITLLLKRQQLSQRQLEHAAGLSEGQLSRMLKRTRPMSLSQVQTVARVLGVPVSDLVAPDAADAAPAASVARVIDNHADGVSNSDTPALLASDGAGGEARWPSPAGAFPQQEHRVFRQGSPVDPRRPGDGVRGGSYEVRPLAPDERGIVGQEGFGVVVTNDSVANWEGSDGQPVRVGAIAWCDPATRGEVRDGELVVAHDPVRGLTLGIYHDIDAGIVLETDDPSLTTQERRHCEPDWVIGPVVYVTALGGRPRRRARGHPAGSSEPTGPAFVGIRSASG